MLRSARETGVGTSFKINILTRASVKKVTNQDPLSSETGLSPVLHNIGNWS